MLCSVYNAISAGNYSQRYLVHQSTSVLTWLSPGFSHLWVCACTPLPPITRALGPIATTAALPRSSAAPLPPITLLYMTASHLTWTARQLAATGANAGPRGDAMSADADASFRRHVSICFPEGLLKLSQCPLQRLLRQCFPTTTYGFVRPVRLWVTHLLLSTAQLRTTKIKISSR